MQACVSAGRLAPPRSPTLTTAPLRKQRRSVGRRMGKYSAAHPHDGVPCRNQKGQRTWKSHQGTEADTGPQFVRSRSMKPKKQTPQGQRPVSRRGDCWVGGCPRWSVPLRGTGYSQPQKTRTSCHSHASSRGFRVCGSDLRAHLLCSGTGTTINCHPSFGSSVFWIDGRSATRGGRGRRDPGGSLPFPPGLGAKVIDTSLWGPCGPSPPSLTPSSLVWGLVSEAGSGRLNSSGTISSRSRAPHLDIVSC